MKNDKHSGNSKSFDITKFSFDDNHDESCTACICYNTTQHQDVRSNNVEQEEIDEFLE